MKVLIAETNLFLRRHKNTTQTGLRECLGILVCRIFCSTLEEITQRLFVNLLYGIRLQVGNIITIIVH